jgi:hypothetical protein
MIHQPLPAPLDEWARKTVGLELDGEEKLGVSYLAMVNIAAVLMWW